MYIKGKEYNLNFIGRERFSGLVWWGFGLTAAALVLAILAFAFSGINLGIEFEGGYLLKVEVDRQAEVSEVKDMLAAYADRGLENPIVQVGTNRETGKDVVTIRLPYIEDEEARNEIISGIKSGLIARYQDPPEAESFELDENGQWVLKVYMKSITPASYVEDLLAGYTGMGLEQYTVETGSEKVGGEDRDYVVVRMTMAGTAAEAAAEGEEATVQTDQSAQAAQVKDALLADLGESQYNIVTKSEEQVGSEWGKEVSRKAILSLAVFLAVILIYISFRFEFKMAVPAIVALIHDTVITVGIYALTGRQVTPATVIAFLTILGYSLYDTIVIFDRISENANLMDRAGRKTYRDIVNASLNQTLMRSIGTTLTTLLPIFTILLFGGDTLKDFAFALFIGVMLGAYSSNFVAAPMLCFWKETEPKYAAMKAKAEKHGAREVILAKKGEKAGAKPASAVKAERVREEEEGEAAPAKKPAAKGTPKAAAKPGAKTQATTAGKPAAKPAPKPGAKKTTRGPASSSKKKKKKKR